MCPTNYASSLSTGRRPSRSITSDEEDDLAALEAALEVGAADEEERRKAAELKRAKLMERTLRKKGSVAATPVDHALPFDEDYPPGGVRSSSKSTVPAAAAVENTPADKLDSGDIAGGTMDGHADVDVSVERIAATPLGTAPLRFGVRSTDSEWNASCLAHSAERDIVDSIPSDSVGHRITAVMGVADAMITDRKTAKNNMSFKIRLESVQATITTRM